MEASVCIEQKGTVEEITTNFIKVRIHREVSCNNCSAIGLCYMGDRNERIIEISDFNKGLKTGDTVKILISNSKGQKAVLIAYLVPFLIIISTLIFLNLVGIKELMSGIIALTLLVPYFIILYLFRNRLQKTFCFSARKIDF